MDNLNRIIIGIENLNNSCYLNSVLQLLFNVEPLNNFLFNYNIIEPTKYEELLLFAYKNLLENIYSIGENTEEYIDNDNILESTQFKNILEKLFPYPLLNGQHDVHEILISIINIFHEGLKKNDIDLITDEKFNDKINKIAYLKWSEYHKNEKYSIISKLFKGQIRTKITCNNCFTENNIFESFMDLSLDITNNNLECCINEYCKPEKLEVYRCEKCNKQTIAEKETILWRLPKYLIIHIKRFEQNIDNIIKDNTLINYPINSINLENKCNYPNNTLNYHLNSIITHHGNLTNLGHYTSKSYINKKVFEIDDEDISCIDDNGCGNPYILLYETDNIVV